jgi:hypothetical protein
MATMELARVDASCATYYLVHTFLAMLTVALMVSCVQPSSPPSLPPPPVPSPLPPSFSSPPPP